MWDWVTVLGLKGTETPPGVVSYSETVNMCVYNRKWFRLDTVQVLKLIPFQNIWHFSQIFVEKHNSLCVLAGWGPDLHGCDPDLRNYGPDLHGWGPDLHRCGLDLHS